MRLTLQFPASGEAVGGTDGFAFVGGRVQSSGEDRDIVFALDSSDSTQDPSGFDVDVDGTLTEAPRRSFLGLKMGRKPVYPGDSILAAEVETVRLLLVKLDPATTRVGLVAFAGDADAMTPDARTLVGLTHDFAELERGLGSLLRGGSVGMTNMVSGVNLSTIELLGTKSALSERRNGARWGIVLFGDSNPTLPVEGDWRRNATTTVRQGIRSGHFGVRIDTFGLGEAAREPPVVLTELARMTGGTFTALSGGRDLRAAVESLDLSGVELSIRNLSLSAAASRVVRGLDGRFGALVPVREGENRIELRARRNDGAELGEEIVFLFDPAAPVAPPPELTPLRDSLVQSRLAIRDQE